MTGPHWLILLCLVGGLAVVYVPLWAIMAMGSYWSRREEARGE